MKYVSIFLLLIVAYVLIEGGRFWYKLENLPTLTAHAHTDLTLGQGPALRYVAAGDSTAVGLGASAIEHTYTNKVAAELAKTHTVTYKNVAVSGSKTQDVLDKQIQQIIDFKPDIVTVSIGANDLIHWISGSTILENDKKIIQELLAKTNATIYITTIPNLSWAMVLPWVYRQILEYKSAQTNPQIMKLENKRVKIVNIHDFGWDQFNDIESTNAEDGFHPGDLGYQNWTNAFLSRIKDK